MDKIGEILRSCLLFLMVLILAVLGFAFGSLFIASAINEKMDPNEQKLRTWSFRIGVMLALVIGATVGIGYFEMISAKVQTQSLTMLFIPYLALNLFLTMFMIIPEALRLDIGPSEPF